MKIIMARPLTKPKITGCGTNRINLPNFSTPAKTCKIPAKITVAKIYSGPCEIDRVTKIMATAPVAPEIIPGRPPRMEVTKPITNAAYNPVKGDSPAIKANATASGIKASATVNPDKTSVL